MSKLLDLAARREVFLRLVRLQDRGCAVSDSFEQVAAEFQISVSLLRMIEQEGLKQEWPPLSGDPPVDEQQPVAEVPTSSGNAASTAALHDPPVNTH